MYKCQYFIAGKIQSVGFKIFTEQTTNKIKIKRFIKNLDNGRVEIVTFFNNEEQIKLFENTLKKGNGYSKIEKNFLDKKITPPPFNSDNFNSYY
ncbi:acylphosphatase (plasmid) [Borrelia miyamotoi]|uniref:Acylphosphatase n=1 Tax=Borrelia miyamotoi TaxID=47466 RepID=A0AAX3JQ10_9SPIR|nr:acylphosphatase [Borrelia miyamotoi]QFP42400.1 acylphosphatase [Borrelia miyamotoi]QFP48520.1 acylphosphatase [Borrelia miyamotoi]WAZ72621.1 acylphosphatase [Borrelia miyamotoi]